MKKSNVSTIGRKDIVLLQKGKQALRMQTSFRLWQGDPDNAITLSIHDLDFENETVEIKDTSGYIGLVSSERFLKDLQSAIESGSTTLYDYNIATYPYFYFADASGNQRGKPFVEIDTESEDNIFAPELDADAYFDSQTAADLQMDLQSTTRTVEQFTANGGKLVWTFNKIRRNSPSKCKAFSG